MQAKYSSPEYLNVLLRFLVSNEISISWRKKIWVNCEFSQWTIISTVLERAGTDIYLSKDKIIIIKNIEFVER